MSQKFLTNGCEFECSLCQGTNKFKSLAIPLGLLVKMNGALVENNVSTMIFPMVPGPTTMCQIKPNPLGVPPYLPCMLMGTVIWNNPSSKHSANKSKLLTEDSFANCPFGGGKLTPKLVSGNVVQNMFQSVVIAPIALQQAGAETKTTTQLQNQGSVKSHSGVSAVDSAGAMGAGAGSMAGMASFDNNQVDNPKNNGEVVPDPDDMMCPYSADKPECKNCSYAKADSSRVKSALAVGNSGVLRQHYEEKFKQIWQTREAYIAANKSYGAEVRKFDKAGYGNEAHHIISTNDILMQPKAGVVRKLFNYYGLDVNDARNCILLPTKTQIGDGISKIAAQNEGMSKMGRQWHRGRHSYGTINHEEFEGDYATLVTEMLCAKVSELSTDKCRSDPKNYETGKKEFEDIFWGVADEVRGKLIQFERNSKFSHPLYVSKVAFAYAYAIPEQVTFMVVGNVGNWLKLAKFVGKRQNIGSFRSSFYDITGHGIDKKDLVKHTMEFECQDEKEFAFDQINNMLFFIGGTSVAFVDQAVADLKISFVDKFVVDMGGLSPQRFVQKKGEQVAAYLLGKENGNPLVVAGQRLMEVWKLNE